MGRRNYNFIYDYWPNDYTVVVYIDGACFNNGRPYAAAGLGVWFNYNHALNLSAPVRGPATNNRGEIQAATRAIYAAGDYGLDSILIKTDSHFLYDAVKGEEWIYLWRDLGWTKTNGEPLSNELDFRALYRAMNKFDMDIDWEHVYAHEGEEGNEEADRLAKLGAEKYRELWVY